MRLIIHVFALILFAPHLLHAQYDDLLRKRSISWVAEYTADYELNPVYNEQLELEMNLAQVVRLENPQGQNGLFPEMAVPYYLSDALLRGIQQGAFLCFADSLLTRPLSIEQTEQRLVKRDTIVKDANDWEGSVVVYTIRREEIDLFRVRQVFYFNSRTKRFDARLLAVAPLVNVMDADGKLVERKPLLWIKMPSQRNCRVRKYAKSANYVVQTFMRENAPAAEQMRTVKGSLDIRKWAANEVRRPARQTLAYEDFRALSIAQLQSRIVTTDTIVVFAPDTFMENAVMVQENATDRVEKIRFVQNWYYDERRHRFFGKLIAVAPLAAVRDSDGNLRYYKPLFYSKY